MTDSKTFINFFIFDSEIFIHVCHSVRCKCTNNLSSAMVFTLYSLGSAISNSGSILIEISLITLGVMSGSHMLPT